MGRQRRMLDVFSVWFGMKPILKRRRIAARLAEVQRWTTTTTAEFAVAK